MFCACCSDIAKTVKAKPFLWGLYLLYFLYLDYVHIVG